MYSTVPPGEGAETLLQRNYWTTCSLFWRMRGGHSRPRDQALGFPWRPRQVYFWFTTSLDRHRHPLYLRLAILCAFFTMSLAHLFATAFAQCLCR